jgi:hypothetical protein
MLVGASGTEYAYYHMSATEYAACRMPHALLLT